MIRTAALALIAVSCAGLGFVKSQALSARIRDLLLLRKILRLLTGEIRYPLPAVEFIAVNEAYSFAGCIPAVSPLLRPIRGGIRSGERCGRKQDSTMPHSRTALFLFAGFRRQGIR